MIRFFDIFFSILGILFLSPLLFVLSFLICIESRGGALFRQKRIGKDGKEFTIYKFRSMRMGSDKKGMLTVGNQDPRVTPLGVFLRKSKLDELPQLFNVLKGDMSFVGPRPELAYYVDFYTPEQRRILCVRPGITDYASIEYIDEDRLLGEADDPDKVYIEQIMPDKIRRNMKYIENRSVKEYFKVIFLTLQKLIR